MSGSVLGWLALGLQVATTWRWFSKALAVELKGSRAPYVIGWSLATLLGVLALMRTPDLAGGIAGGASVALGVVVLALIAVSPQKVAPDAVSVGARLPEFTALDDDGVPFTLSGIEGRPILLKFFRGHW
jgi:hypothetical protein